MYKLSESAKIYSRPAPIIIVTMYFFFITIFLRTLAERDLIANQLTIFLIGEFLFGLFFTLVLWFPPKKRAWSHLYFTSQTVLVLCLLVPFPQLDFYNILLALLSFQAPLVFSDRSRWIWIIFFVVLIILSLTILLGVYGFALSLLAAAAAIIFPAYVIVDQEIETRQRKRRSLLIDLQQANQKLIESASQVEELSTIQERNRLARELHDSVSQIIFSINLNTSATRIMLEREPDQVRPQLEKLQALSQNALSEMRSLITHMHNDNQTDKGPTS